MADEISAAFADLTAWAEENPMLFAAIVVTATFVIRRLRFWWKLRRYTRVGAEYDFVVCGSSPAGCVVANRLVKRGGHSVLVLEAGDDDSEHDKVFYLSYAADLARTAVDWCYKMTGTALGNSQPILQPHGKVLGGQSAIDWGLYVRPADAYLNRLAAVGADGWGADDCFPFVARSQCSRIHTDSDPHHGKSGELPIGFVKTQGPLGKYGGDAAARCGIPKVYDINGEVACGVSPAASAVGGDGRRVSAASAFLRPLFSSSLLAVKTGAAVQRVLWEGKRAVGVEWKDRRGRTHQVKARKEVILSCGTVGTPAVLMRSGVGPGGSVVDAPAVGLNLQDHVSVPLTYQTRAGVSYDPQNCHYLQHYIAYLIQGSGPLMSGMTDLVMRVSSAINGLDRSWLEDEEAVQQEARTMFKRSEGKKDIDHVVALVPKGGYRRPDFERLGVSEDLGKFTEGMTWMVSPVPLSACRPDASRGKVTLDADGELSVEVAYTASEKGTTALNRVMRLCRRIVATDPLSRLSTLREAIDLTLLQDTKPAEAYYHLYGTGARKRQKLRGRKIPAELREKLDRIRDEVDRDDYLCKYVQKHSRAFGAATGTCSMAPLEAEAGKLPAVVSAKSLSVVGVEGLRVADASVLPLPPTTPGCAPALLVGERASEWILDSHKAGK
eukprot:TRINITY_DN9406_c0_g1_i1.p1 TRINITY_DN9406_c0_g1~~TRINITY_DN9406_c0_g1_i1.p1  ORF type:complete len:666 (+),score=163.17 TRINITY_DN9406_c0_g1_i1:61-2058(+)